MRIAKNDAVSSEPGVHTIAHAVSEISRVEQLLRCPLPVHAVLRDVAKSSEYPVVFHHLEIGGGFRPIRDGNGLAGNHLVDSGDDVSLTGLTRWLDHNPDVLTLGQKTTVEEDLIAAPDVVSLLAFRRHRTEHSHQRESDEPNAGAGRRARPHAITLRERKNFLETGHCFSLSRSSAARATTRGLTAAIAASS